jgi:hypothetical protein
LEQDVAAGEQRHHQPLNDNSLSNDDRADSVADVLDKLNDTLGHALSVDWF